MNDTNATTGQVSTRVDQDILMITLTRPNKLNALTSEMLFELVRAIDSSADMNIQGITLTGAGDVFSAGHDLSSKNQAHTRDEAISSVEAFHEVTRACLRTTVPTIAVLNGLAVGGAFEMTLAFDRRIGTPATEIFVPENSLGLTISNASSYLMSRLIGPSATLDFVLASQRIDASKALRLGLIEEIAAQNPMNQAVERIHEYNPDGSTTHQHLKLLRPQPKEVEAAIGNETAAAEAAWDAGITEHGVNAFWRQKKDS